MTRTTTSGLRRSGGLRRSSLSRPAALVATLGLAVSGLVVSTGSTDGAVAAPSPEAPLTNLDHLDFLGDTATPRATARHTTYRLAREPEVGMLWTYADKRDEGFERIGGGTEDPETGDWTQGAYNADDISRAAIVYVRHFEQTGDQDSLEKAYQLLRGLTYMQVTRGKDRGNVVLWMQPDGSLNRSAEPVELPDPSDSDASYWLARTVWALGEAVPAFRDEDPRFARFLERRLALSLGAVERQVLDQYGEYYRADGRRTPAWLIVDGADATAEAVIGLAALNRDGGTKQSRRVMRQLAEGVAGLSGGDARRWPFGGVLPWGLSRSIWHGWASQMGGALAAASQVSTGSTSKVARRDAFTFDPWLITSGGPDNGRQPTRADQVQIAYGADSRVQNLLAHGTRAGDELAGVHAAWFFGANNAGVPTYDPATGVTIDGVEADGRVNQNSGAESTIHGLLTMLQLDAHPRVAEIARTAEIGDGVGVTELQAEEATLAGGARAVTPESRWTGESQYGGTGFARLPVGGRATFAVPADQPASLVMPVTDYRPRSRAVTTYTAAGERVGAVRSGAIGAQGRSEAPGALLPQTLRVLPDGATSLVARTRGGAARVDAVVLQPLVTSHVLGGDGHGTAVLRNAAARPQRTEVTVPGDGTARVHVYDGLGRPVRSTTTQAADVPVRLPAGGFAVVRR
ncbi:hypothetical protein [Nocardioides aequoreus]|uniref:hypothetical protein n=1 Tax=Nocardioides aequoreus TaxID=397278 RepID=UPI0012F6D9D6|nr:hypothetical protein [Nocardioides aequoreus]